MRFRKHPIVLSAVTVFVISAVYIWATRPPATPDSGPGTRSPLHADAAYGGRVIVHIDDMPSSLCFPLVNSVLVQRMQAELSESLLRQDLRSFEFLPSVASSFVREDMVVLKYRAADDYSDAVPAMLREDVEGSRELRERVVLYGSVVDDGNRWRVTPRSEGHALSGMLRVPKSDVARIERGTVFTFELRDDVLWHPTAKVSGHALDARDVYFSWSLYQNEDIDCDAIRANYSKVTRAEVVDAQHIRFFYDEQYFKALETIAGMTLLPSHVYDLSDPDNPDYSQDATAESQAQHVNAHPHNREWIGLGPYRVTAMTNEFIDTERFEGYFDDARAGYVDAIRFRHIDEDNTAFLALQNGELDFFGRVSSADYFGPATETEQFTEGFKKGHYFLGVYGFLAWNLFQPHLAEKEVRQALAHAFDFEEYARAQYKGVANQVTGIFPHNSPAYNHDVEPFPFDPDRAVELLTEAGWYDRDGDGIVDKDDAALVIEFLMPTGNEASLAFGRKLQESFSVIGVKLTMTALDWPTLTERKNDRTFDALSLAWFPPLEADPEAKWHSKWGAFDKRGQNYSGVQSQRIDDLIALGQREINPRRRWEIWHEMHRVIYDLQPYMFLWNVPTKYAISRRIHGFEAFAIDPGYSIRSWYFTADEPGTRPHR